jgi:SRSO17 transposase
LYQGPGPLPEAGVPKDIVFATKPRQAVELFAEAEDAGVPTGGSPPTAGYGQYREVRQWATDHDRKYVVAVPSSQPLARVHAIAGTESGKAGQAAVARADDLLARATLWERRSCGHGAKGERYWDWRSSPSPVFAHSLGA